MRLWESINGDRSIRDFDIKRIISTIQKQIDVTNFKCFSYLLKKRKQG